MVGKLEISENGILRSANWAVETILPFSNIELSNFCNSINLLEKQIESRADIFINEIYNTVQLVNDKKSKFYLINLKRQVFNKKTILNIPNQKIKKELEKLPIFYSILLQELEFRKEYNNKIKLYNEKYSIEIEHQNEILFKICSETKFKKALIFANLEFYHSLKSYFSQKTKKTDNRKIATLFFYLMRAVGKPTPNMLWAGVSSFNFNKIKKNEEKNDSAHNFTLNLSTLKQALSNLLKKNSYRLNYPLYLNPTIVSAENEWIYESRFGENIEIKRLPKLGYFPIFIKYFQSSASIKAEFFLCTLSNGNNDKYNLFVEVINTLIDIDILRVDLQIELNGTDIWQNLFKVADNLINEDSILWKTALKKIKHICDLMSKKIEIISIEKTEEYIKKIENEYKLLLTSAGVDTKIMEPLVYVDFKIPFRANLNKKYFNLIEKTILQWLSFYNKDGVAELYRKETNKVIFEMTGGKKTLNEILKYNIIDIENNDIDNENKIIVEKQTNYFINSREFVFGRFKDSKIIKDNLHKNKILWEANLKEFWNLSNYKISRKLLNKSMPIELSGSILLPYWDIDNVTLGKSRPQLGLFSGRFTNLLNFNSKSEIENINSELLKWLKKSSPEAIEVYFDDVINLNASFRPNLTKKKLMFMRKL